MYDCLKLYIMSYVKISITGKTIVHNKFIIVSPMYKA